MAPLIEKTYTAEVAGNAALREQAVRALRALPPFSPILNRLLATLAGEDVAFGKLADLIEKDTVVAGNVLHLVNSALYARRGTINSVRHAISLLGVNKLRNAVLGMSVTRMWQQVRPAGAWSMARFNQHSAATAILSDMLAQRLAVDYPEGAFLAGLMHDVGRLLIAVGLPAEFDRIVAYQRAARCSAMEAETAVLGFSHPELSAEALAVWKLPEPIQLAVRDHHEPRFADPSHPLALSGVVNAADRFVHSTGISIVEQSGGANVDTAPLLALGLSQDCLDRLLSDFEVEFEAMTPYFR